MNTTFALYSIAAFGLTLLFIMILRSNYKKLKLIDIPNERSSHSTIIPRVGGTAVFVPFFLICLILAFLNSPNREMSLLLLMAFLMFLIGFWDDVKGAKASIKFLLEFIIILAGVCLLFKSPNIIIVVILTVFVMWVMNSFNFMDGIDGFAALHSIPIFLAYYIVTHNIVFLIVPCALFAFLFFNFPPAKVFMGDAGSLPLGFLIGMTPFLFFTKDLHWPNIYNIILVAYFITLCDITFFFDASLTLTKRAIRRTDIFKAHREHIYQKAFDAGTPAWFISIFNCILTIISTSCAVYLFNIRKNSNIFYYIIPSIIIAVIYLDFITIVCKRKKENV